MIVRSHKPTSLEEAYNYALQYSNAACRQKLEKNRDSHPIAPKKPMHTPPMKPFVNRSEKYKISENTKAQTGNDDVSMRTYRSKGQMNNHEQEEKQKKTKTIATLNWTQTMTITSDPES